MSTLQVKVCTIDDVMPHPDPKVERLETVQVAGWSCVTQKGTFKRGDKCVYIPIDSVLPHTVEERLFPADAKIKLTKSRVKTIRIRGCVSQGMCVPLTDLAPANTPVGKDLTETLGITKYEPPRKENSQTQGRKQKRGENPHFRKFTDLENVKWYPEVFAEGDEVVITEKIHGSNFRAGWVPFVPQTWWEKVKDWFGWNPLWEFVYGSRNVQLQRKDNPDTYYGTDVYGRVAKEYKLDTRIPKGHVFYGEIYGPSIQKGYHYGLKNDELGLVLFDAYDAMEGHYWDYTLSREFFEMSGLPTVPELYAGPFTKSTLDQYVTGNSVIHDSQKVREGVVIRPLNESTSTCGRKILKAINAEYLLSKHADEESPHDLVA